MNFSIDDTSPNFVWSSGADDWKGQAPNQVAINSNYFLSTYHATQSKGSNVAITFVGAAIQLYGSKGPNHGNYSVTYDSAIKFFAGFSAQTQYQQLLFSRTFGTNYSETHTVILKNEEDYWLDLDFAVLSIAYVVIVRPGLLCFPCPRLVFHQIAPSPWVVVYRR
ncbi:hypothetical protein M408DRAFT_291466 [Serendipita vermifera MAFF 305830]|uniref:Uncharacterized protein n=1 Tax=Serendipita vermifera MAFF 305830 TaxID=933852 RepID=A0A0C3ASU2_SERVB|nr:hypothetical protein M408DRAFT_291466 [Serendipita vermifera MAFF 305830]